MTRARLRVYADRRLVPVEAGHVPLLEPLWGPSADKYADLRSPLADRFRPWRESGVGIVEEARLEDADVAVLPAGWEHYARRDERRAAAAAYAERVRAAGKPLVVFYVADSTEPVPLPGAHVFRTSATRSALGEREHVMPAAAVDLVERELGGTLPLREWRARPVVGFCGYVPDVGVRGRVTRLARRMLGRPDHPAYLRTRACRALRRSRRVEPSFVFRPAYWAGAVRADGSLDYELMRAARDEFVRNLVESDYVLAVRGGGNFSVRLYEALACGRVPVFVNSDAVLPFEDRLDWRALCVWVDEDEVGAIGDAVAEHHARLDPESFEARQRACRRAYVDLLAPDAYFRALVPFLRGLPP